MTPPSAALRRNQRQTLWVALFSFCAAAIAASGVKLWLEGDRWGAGIGMLCAICLAACCLLVVMRIKLLDA